MESTTAAPSATTLDGPRPAGWLGDTGTPAVIVVRTPYEHRVELVSDVLRNSGATAADATRLAVRVLQALDHIPERVR